MPPERFETFLAGSIAWYAQENVAAGRWSASQALKFANDDIARSLPQGQSTPGHRFFGVVDDGSVVGSAWLGEMPRGELKVAYVYQIFIDANHRRRGHARAALIELESISRELGYPTIALNVFGHNTAAQVLYRSIGYAPFSMTMQKDLAPRA